MFATPSGVTRIMPGVIEVHRLLLLFVIVVLNGCFMRGRKHTAVWCAHNALRPA